MASTIRIHVDPPLSPGQSVPLEQSQAHYLFSVMRRDLGDPVEAFNGRDGSWACEITEKSRKSGAIVAKRQVAPQRDPPDLWLCFAPIKKARTDFIVEKATELGAARILPVSTAFTNSERIRRDRLQAHAVEAAEQCGGTYVPEVGEIVPLGRMLDDWPAGRRIMFCDEALAEAAQTADLAKSGDAGRWAIIIGPEGGFSEEERRRLRSMPGAQPVRLGPRILRADTAAVAALTLWQDRLGDWR